MLSFLKLYLYILCCKRNDAITLWGLHFTTLLIVIVFMCLQLINIKLQLSVFFHSFIVMHYNQKQFYFPLSA